MRNILASTFCCSSPHLNFRKCEFFPKEKKEERRTHFHKLKGKNWWINQLGLDT
jgi:hypothetical protein